jgi:hypothetical protein
MEFQALAINCRSGISNNPKNSLCYTCSNGVQDEVTRETRISEPRASDANGRCRHPNLDNLNWPHLHLLPLILNYNYLSPLLLLNASCICFVLFDIPSWIRL